MTGSDPLSSLLGMLFQAQPPQAGAPTPAPPTPAPAAPGTSDLMRRVLEAKLAQAQPTPEADPRAVSGNEDDQIEQELSHIPASKVTLDPNAIDTITGMGGRGPFPKPQGVKEHIAAALHGMGLGMEGPQGSAVLAHEKGEQSDYEKAKAVARLKFQQEQNVAQSTAQKESAQQQNMQEERKLQRRGQDITQQDAQARLAESSSRDKETEAYRASETARKVSEDKEREADKAANLQRENKRDAETAQRDAAHEKNETARTGMMAQAMKDREAKAAAGPKPTADEQRRSDLASNMNENIATIREIATRRPELFGPVAGRLTGVKASLGTHDPDIAALEGAKHRLGQVQMSSHGMRSAQGIEAASESIMNSMHNDAPSTLKSLDEAEKSGRTFIIGDESYVGTGVKQSGQAAPAKGQAPAQPARRVIDLTK